MRSIIDSNCISPDRVDQQPQAGKGITDDVLFPNRRPTQFRPALSTTLTGRLAHPTFTAA